MQRRKSLNLDLSGCFLSCRFRLNTFGGRKTTQVITFGTGPNQLQMVSSCQPKDNSETLVREGTLLPASKQEHTGNRSQSSVSPNKVPNPSLQGEIMHKYGGRLCHCTCRWGRSSSRAVRKHGYTYMACSKMVESLRHWVEIFVL